MKHVKYTVSFLLAAVLLLSCAACTPPAQTGEITAGCPVSSAERDAENTEEKLLSIPIPAELYSICGDYLSQHVREWGGQSLVGSPDNSAQLKLAADCKSSFLASAKKQIVQDLGALENQYDYIVDLQIDESFTTLTILSRAGDYRKNNELNQKALLYASAYQAVCQLPQEEGTPFTLRISAVDCEDFTMLDDETYPKVNASSESSSSSQEPADSQETAEEF